ncbi:unnamed protein product [Toxocara canis]|uniref:Uncharacterized protein n=1 Tax=Toxocara canis TaxID=6265 RepID=A0A183V4C7_TOXCA|nr:unnamed protein product [Toxocara canis]
MLPWWMLPEEMMLEERATPPTTNGTQSTGALCYGRVRPGHRAHTHKHNDTPQRDRSQLIAAPRHPARTSQPAITLRAAPSRANPPSFKNTTLPVSTPYSSSQFILPL